MCAIGPGSSTATAVAKFSGTNGLTLAASGGVFIDASDRLGLGTSAPTHSLTLAASSTGRADYNTSDQVTNYERAIETWSGNVYTISTESGGTGALRSLLLRGGPAGGQLLLSPFGSMTLATTSGTGIIQAQLVHTTLTNTSSVQSGLVVAGTVNQTSGTGGYTGVLVNPTLTAVGSSGAKLIDLQTSNTSRFFVSSSGATDYENTNTAGGTVGAQTINKPCGTVNVAAAGTSLVVTNSLVSTSTILSVQARTNDSTCAVKNYVPGSGSFTINMTAGCTAETSVGFCILDKN